MDLDVLVPKIMPLKPIDVREIVRGASSETEEVVITAESFVESYTGEELADHYGAQKPSGAPDPTVPLPAAPQSR
jgi:hypothetical protein